MDTRPRLRWKLTTIALFTISWGTSPLAKANLMSFTTIDALPGTSLISPGGISADGSVIVGSGIIGANNQFGFRWTSQTGIQMLQPYAGDIWSQAYEVSADGNTIVGATKLTISSSRGVRWTTLSNPQLITDGQGAPLQVVNGVSGDGSAVIGSTVQHGYLANADGVLILPGLSSGHDTKPYGISNDGLTVAGYSTNSSNQMRAVRWTQAGGTQDLGVLPGFTNSWALDVSGDGSTVVGRLEGSGDSSSVRAFRWNSQGGLQNLGKLPAYSYTQPTSTSVDGEIVVGIAADPIQNRAWIWTPQSGMQDLTDFLAPVIPSDIIFSTVIVSDDGRVLTGYASIAGQRTAWIAEIPEPATGTFLQAGLSIWISVRRRRKNRSV